MKIEIGVIISFSLPNNISLTLSYLFVIPSQYIPNNFNMDSVSTLDAKEHSSQHAVEYKEEIDEWDI